MLTTSMLTFQREEALIWGWCVYVKMNVYNIYSCIFGLMNGYVNTFKILDQVYCKYYNYGMVTYQILPDFYLILISIIYKPKIFKNLILIMLFLAINPLKL